MKRNFLLIIFFIVAQLNLIAQTCSGDFFFNTQQQIDDFLIQNPTCTSIEDTISIWIDNSDITNLDGFQNIQSVIGEIYFYGGDYPVSLSGFSSLTYVEGNIYVEAGEYLDLTGLENLQSISGVLSVTIACQDLSVFDNLEQVSAISLGSNSDFGSCPMVANFPNVTELDAFILEGSLGAFSGMNAVTSIQQMNIAQIGFNLESFDAFHSLQTAENIYFGLTTTDFISGFENLTECGNIYIETLANMYPSFESLVHANDIAITYWSPLTVAPIFNSLESVDNSVFFMGPATSIGFQNLKRVGGNFEIFGEPVDWDDYGSNLASFGPFPLLDTIVGDFSIGYFSMINLDALNGLDFIGGNVHINDCLNLSDCAISLLCERLLDDPVSVILSNNGAGCNSLDEVAAMCGVSYVSGNVYADLDCDGVFGNNDVPLNNVIVRDENDMPIGTIYNDGGYYVGLPDNTTSNIHATTPVGFLPADEYSFTTTSMDSFNPDNDFAFCPDLNYHDLSVFVYSYGMPRPGYDAFYVCKVMNLGTNTEQAELVLDFSGMPGASVVNAYTGVVSGTTISWSIPSLDYNQEMSFVVRFHVATTVPIGSIYHGTASVNILPSSILDNNILDNNFTDTGIVTNSYDPNDITVNITDVNYDEISSTDQVTLDYTIRFQNTGTAEAINVRVDDFIEEDLDLSTFQMLDASHPFQLSFDENRKVEWLFENILLPDSLSNEPASHGFIHFRIKTKDNLQLTDIIENAVAIYFDFNEPVITNTASTSFYVCPEPISISGVEAICQSEEVTLTASENWNEYSWTLNGNQVSSTNEFFSNSLTAGSNELLLEASTDLCSSNTSFTVDVFPTPITPVITQIGNTLTATGTGAFTWTLNGETLNDTDSSIEITETGNYGVSYVEVCPSLSASGTFEFVGVYEWNGSIGFLIAPNPSSDVVTITLPSNWVGQNELKVTDATGRVVLSEVISFTKTTLNSSSFPVGCYLISIMNSNSGKVDCCKWMIE